MQAKDILSRIHRHRSFSYGPARLVPLSREHAAGPARCLGIWGRISLRRLWPRDVPTDRQDESLSACGTSGTTR
jgi:hypothetical protein